MAVQIEVGKAYRTRGGERVEIEDTGRNPEFPFMGRCQSGFWCSYNEFGGSHFEGDQDIIAEWTDEPEPEIDWGGELQVRSIQNESDSWDDFTAVWHDDNVVYGWINKPINGGAWRLDHWQFRNKPPEVKRVRGWVNVYKSHSPSRDWCVICYRNRSDADKAAANDRLACIEIDVPEGEGL